RHRLEAPLERGKLSSTFASARECCEFSRRYFRAASRRERDTFATIAERPSASVPSIQTLAAMPVLIAGVCHEALSSYLHFGRCADFCGLGRRSHGARCASGDDGAAACL